MYTIQVTTERGNRFKLNLVADTDLAAFESMLDELKNTSWVNWYWDSEPKIETIKEQEGVK